MQYFRRPAMFIIGSIILFSMIQLPVRAQEEAATITDDQLVQIRNRCSEIQSTLSQVHANDALLRVNRGQLYELISTKLMARLNSRIALNRLDSSGLVAVANSYEVHLKDFRSNYQTYEELLSDTIRTNCTDQPVSFYDKLQETRKKRAEVYKNTQDIAQDIKAYRAAFDLFAKPYMESAS